MLFGLGAPAAERKLKVQDLPPAVRQTVKQETANATLVGLSKEVEKGKTVYALETTKARKSSIPVTADGAITR